MEQNLNSNDSPQIIENNNSSHNSTHHSSPIFLILASLLIFVSTAAILFFNYKRTSKADYRNTNNYIQQYQNKIQTTTGQAVTPTPTPANPEESTIDSIVIDDASSDLSTIDQAAAGL